MAYYLGIDIGGTKIKAALFNGLNKQKTRLFSVDTPKNKKKLFLILEKLVLEIIAGKKVAGVGVGVPGWVDSRNGILLRAKNLSFLKGWKVKKFFKKYTRQVKVDNDSRCMVRAEAAWGAGQGYKNITGLAIGTGIGGGILIDGKIYYGSRNVAGEFGHTIIHAPHNSFPVKSFEELAGRKAFLKYGDRSAIVGMGVANLIRAFDPDIVVLGGGGVTSGAVKIDQVKRFVRSYIRSPHARKTPILKGKLGDAAGAVGAALLFKMSA